jgi:hypothetical protein
MTGLQYLVDMEPSKSAVSDGLPPGEDRRVWSPTASMLTHGVRDAVFVDAAYEDAHALERGRVRQEDGKCSERPEKLGYPRVGERSDRSDVRALTRSILEYDRVSQRFQHQSAPVERPDPGS